MDPFARLIDATANRASEGLRVLEDLARFVLDDESLTRTLKDLRHDLRRRIEALPVARADLLAARDVPNDVGADLTGAGESDRGGPAGVATAAAKRAQEALRSLEEAAKALGSDARGFESARYRLYTAEQQLLQAIAPPCPQWTLCVLVTRDLCAHHAPAEVIRRAAEGGADCVQIREKGMDDAERLDHTGEMVAACRKAGVHAVVNDRPDLARLAGADAVHLGQRDLPVAAARRVLGPGRWIGVSCSTPDQARAAWADGADSIGLGPMFPSTTKPKPDLAGPALVRAVVEDPRAGRLPHLAISGINAANAGTLAAAGCRGVAVSGAVCSAEDPAGVCRAIIAALRGPPATIAP